MFVFTFLYKYVPTFNMFQAPTRFMILAEFCLCLLTGIGLERIKPPEGRKLYWARLGTMAAAAIAIGAVITLLLFPQIKSTLIRGTASFGVILVACGLLILFQPRKDNKKVIWEGLLILLVAADLLAAHWNFNPITDKSLFMLDAGESESMCRRIYMSESNEYVVKYGWFSTLKPFSPRIIGNH